MYFDDSQMVEVATRSAKPITQVAENVTIITDYGPWAQTNWGVPGQDESRPGFEEVWGLFVNDTLRLGLLTLTPGIRYDQHSISGSMVSPSLGATYLLRPDTLLRATASRGFQYPVLSFIAGGGIWDNPNTELNPEEVSSIQVGVESRTLSFMSVKFDAFLHHVTDTWWMTVTWIITGRIAGAASARGSRRDWRPLPGII